MPAIYFLLLLNVGGLLFSIAVSSIAMGSAIVLWIIFLAVEGRSAFPRTSLDLFFVCYLGAELLATMFSIDPAASIVNAKRLFLISNLYLVLTAVSDDVKLKYCIIVVAAISTILTAIEIVSITEIGGHFMRVSIFQYYLTEGGLKMIVLLMLIPFVVHADTPKHWRIFSLGAIAILMIGLIITQTRSSWLGFIAGAVTIAVLKNKKLLFAILALLVIFVLFAPTDFTTRAASMFDPNMKSNLSRIHMLTTGWRMFLDYPLTGTGDIDLRKLYETYIVPIDSGEGGHLHNNYMMLLVTLGGIGFIATTAMFVAIFIAELRAERATRSHWLYGSIALGSIAAYVGFLVNGLFEWNFGDHEIAVFLWFTVGLALVSQRRILGTDNVKGVL